ncbi:MAG: germination protein YpeB [Clostridia bacterium]|nr:germination protein YpeB [Clostridia bacterium]
MKSLEIDDMMPVWVNLSNNVYTVNLAYSIQGVPVYSDLVKVRVCADSGKILGMEAMTYYTNHTERVVKTPTLTVQQAQEKVSSTITIDTTRLSIVPIGNSSERLAYEFSGENNGDTYYVYIDAETGAQLQMFKVINSNNGTLLM